MRFRRHCRGALLGVLLVACGERAGDPVIKLASDTADAGGAGSDGPPSYAGSNVAGRAPFEEGAVGLCGACETSEECGDENDACVTHEGSSFCGRDCDDGWGCPGGYTCVDLDNSPISQCVPTSACPVGVQGPPALEQVRSYLLARINAERAARGRGELMASGCLDQLAQGSALELGHTDVPLGKYLRECEPNWPNCSCGWNAEAEVAIARYELSWLTAIESALDSSRSNNDDRFIDAFLDNDLTDVGIGFWISGDEAWIALSFR